MNIKIKQNKIKNINIQLKQNNIKISQFLAFQKLHKPTITINVYSF